MTDDDNSKSQDSQTQIIIAVIGLLGAVGVAVISNWDKLFPTEISQPQPTSQPPVTTISPPQSTLTPQATVSPAPIAEPVPVSPSVSCPESEGVTDEFIRNHYLLINQGEYESSWNNLSSDFQRRFEGGLVEYENYWQNEPNIASILVDKVNTIDQSSNQKVVSTQLVYRLRNGDVTAETRRIVLICDENTLNLKIRSSEIVQQG